MCKWNPMNYSLCKCRMQCFELNWWAIILYIESVLYFVATNVNDYEYCYALFGLMLLAILSCVTATIYLYAGHYFMCDMLSGPFTVLNIVVRVFTIIGFSHCAVQEDAINESHGVLSVMLSINISVTASLIALFTTMTRFMCLEYTGNSQRRLDKVRAELASKKTIYDAKINDTTVKVAKSIYANIPAANIMKTW